MKWGTTMSRKKGKRLFIGLFLILFWSLSELPEAAESEGQGRFLRLYWFETGLEHGNPLFTSRLRVNDPEAVIGSYSQRSEVRSNGLMQILTEEDLMLLESADLYIELWGGHPGTTSKRVTPNGRTTYFIEDVGTTNENCTYSYPVIPLEITDLVNGYNAFQFACDKGNSFWGHFLIDNACLRAGLKSDHPDLEKMGLAGFPAFVQAIPKEGVETIALSLACPRSFTETISSVEYHGFYNGYDENGDTFFRDWHGFTKNREPAAILGTSDRRPYNISWDTSMLPEQSNMAVRAIVHFKEHPNLIYITHPTENLQTPQRDNLRVILLRSYDLPTPFWSRANNKKTCTLEMNINPKQIEKAQLHINTWDGGRGTIENYFTLNGHPLKAAGEGKHDLIYSILDIEPAWLHRGANQIELLSDTEHHGIEVMLPGPVLIVREKIES